MSIDRRAMKARLRDWCLKEATAADTLAAEATATAARWIEAAAGLRRAAQELESDLAGGAP